MPVFGEQFRRFYPGLKPAEARVWRQWLRDHETEWDSFTYNVHVGEGVKLPERALTGDPELDKRLRDGWLKLTQAKIDVLATYRGETWILEVEERADAATLGQLLVYQHLAPGTIGDVPVLNLGVVCERIGADLMDVLDEQGVAVWKVTLPA